MRKLVQHSNVVVNCIGSNVQNKNYEDCEHANVHLARRIAKTAKKMGVTKFIHFSSVGASPDSPSWDLKSKYYGELAVREEFPEAVILRLCPVISPDDKVQDVFVR